MKKSIILRVLAALLLTLLLITSYSYAMQVGPITIIPKPPPDGGTIDKVDNIRGKVLFGVQLVGTIIAISTLMIIGIKYMISAPEGKAQYKRQAAPFILGSVLLFGAVAIVEVIKQFGTNL